MTDPFSWNHLVVLQGDSFSIKPDQMQVGPGPPNTHQYECEHPESLSVLF